MKDATETFNTVYDATFRELMRYCLCKVPIADADDLLQNTYAQFYRTLVRKGIRAIRDPKAYLFIILKHEIAGYHRSRKRHSEIPFDEIPSNIPSDDSVEDLSLDYVAIDEITKRLKAEPERTQRMFILYYGYGMKLGDIALEMGTTAAGVKSKLLRVRKKLRATEEKEKTL
ncbi:MAG: RNA polymerase sigma factor [Clostridia bacterium]|nr:RNA polymerase sigma factor [Clostridia bacterium]